jgi:branched-chain amino acid transport system substrate-binding protein
MSVIEETQLRGTLLAIHEINERGGVRGRPIKPVIYDPSSEASAFGRYAKKLMVEDGVTTIFGCYTSSSRKAVLPVVERLNGLLWYPTLYEGFEFSPNVIYSGAGPNQNSLALFRYLMKHHGKRFYFVGSNYVYPHVSNRIMHEFVRHNAGQVVGERYVSLRPRRADFYEVVREIRDLRPDAIFSTVVGDGTTYLYQAYAENGFDPKQMPIASLTTTEAEVRAMGFDVAEGHITAAPYFQGVENEQNRRFLMNWKKIYGDDESTNMCCEAAYFQVHLFARAGKGQFARYGTASLGDPRRGCRCATGTHLDQSRLRPRQSLEPDRARQSPRAVRYPSPVRLRRERRPLSRGVWPEICFLLSRLR